MLKEFFDTHTQKVFSKDGYGVLYILVEKQND
jgi:hypothetical protein